MKNVLIIAEPRTGSSNLLNAISSAYGFKSQFEPQPKDVLTIPGWVVKVISHEHFSLESLVNLVPKFECTILLSRKNLKEQYESFWALFNLNGRSPFEKWHVSKLPVDKDQFIFRKNYIDKCKVRLKEVSESVDLPINYYEEVYSKKRTIPELKLDLKYLSATKKCRQEFRSSLI